MTEKQIRYAEIPEFDQATQYVIQLPPVETDEEIFYGVEIKTLEQSNEQEECF
jgi:hypothetical protein